MDQRDVIQMADDPQCVTIDPADAAALAQSNDCDRAFSRIFDTLHVGFGRDKDQLATIDDDIFGLTIDDLLKRSLMIGPMAGFHAGPRFLYVPASQR
jgi:hypothetical protein